MFQPARPPEMWSRLANARARLYGSLNVVEAVAIRPSRSVTPAIAVRRLIGSRPWLARYGVFAIWAGMSAKKTASSLAASAFRASSW